MNRRLSELVKVYDGTLPEAACERICRLFDHSASHYRKLDGVKSFNELVIDGDTSWLQYSLMLEKAKDDCLIRYQHDCPGIFPDHYDHEAFRIKRYDPERRDRFEEHVDAYNLDSAKRFLVCFWYLNDVAQGGETAFTRLGLKVQPRRGRLVMFPPFWMYEHAAFPPISEAKYIISTYFLFA